MLLVKFLVSCCMYVANVHSFSVQVGLITEYLYLHFVLRAFKDMNKYSFI